MHMRSQRQVSEYRIKQQTVQAGWPRLASVSSREEFVDEESVVEVAIWAKACIPPGFIPFLQQASTQLGMLLHACTACKC